MSSKTPIKKHKTKHHNSYAFTLVELIVVITMLTILSIIAFVSVGNFSSNARDSIRISDIKSLHQGLIISKTKIGEYPLPENAIEIRDINNILTYQGYAGEAATRLSRINKTPLDPKDTARYIYTVNENKTKLQLMGYLESGDTAKIVSYTDSSLVSFDNKLESSFNISLANTLNTSFSRIFETSFGNLANFNNLTNQIQNNLTNQAFAATTNIDYRSRFTYAIGDKLGVLTDENKTPVQETTTATGINLSTTNSGYVAYFGGNTFGAGQSTGTGQTLINQMISAQNNTLPCDALSYSGYTITPLLHNEIKIFTKPLTIANGSGTGSLQVQCINGTLDTLHATETPNITCNSSYVNQSNTCVLDVCGGIMPTDAQSTATSQTVSQNWTRSAVAGACTFDCKNGYTWVSSSSSCLDQTPPTITSVTVTTTGTQPACNTVRFTINGAADTVALHTTPYSFDGGSTWQPSNIKDYSTTSQTIVANQIKVKDATGNIYTYMNSVSGTANGCAVNCSYTTTGWGACSASCGGGTQSYYYHITIPAANGGTCGVSEGQIAGTQTCNTGCCPSSAHACAGTYFASTANGCTNDGDSCWGVDGSKMKFYQPYSNLSTACKSGSYQIVGGCNSGCKWIKYQCN